MKADHLFAPVLEAVFSFQGAKANAINSAERITMAIETFTFL
jgi:hypothetical protein